MAQPIRAGESAIDISALPFHGHAHLMAWTQRYAYGATARARRGIFTLSGSGARACANELEDEFEERCGSQKMKGSLMDGGRQTDMAQKDAGRSRGAAPSSLTKQGKTNEQKKVRVVAPAEVPHDTRICIADLVDTDFDESDVDELRAEKKEHESKEQCSVHSLRPRRMNKQSGIWDPKTLDRKEQRQQ